MQKRQRTCYAPSATCLGKTGPVGGEDWTSWWQVMQNTDEGAVASPGHTPTRTSQRHRWGTRPHQGCCTRSRSCRGASTPSPRHLAVRHPFLTRLLPAGARRCNNNVLSLSYYRILSPVMPRPAPHRGPLARVSHSTRHMALLPLSLTSSRIPPTPCCSWSPRASLPPDTPPAGQTNPGHLHTLG